jgi:hypothetical protein
VIAEAGITDFVLVGQSTGAEVKDMAAKLGENDVAIAALVILAVAEHYYRFDGVSPLNGENRRLLEALEGELALPLYWGNRNWHPLLEDTVKVFTKALQLTVSRFEGGAAPKSDVAQAQTQQLLSSGFADAGTTPVGAAGKKKDDGTCGMGSVAAPGPGLWVLAASLLAALGLRRRLR